MPFGGGSQSTGSQSSQSSTQIVPGMMDVYNQLLNLNQQNYGNILSAYTQGGNQLNQNLSGIQGGYSNLGAGIQNTLGMGQVLGKNGNWGVATPAAQAIGQTFAQQQGRTDQQMINAGLGNTTVRGNLQNQNALMAGQAYGGLGAQLAQTAAGYQSQVGLAGLGAQMQGAGLQSQFAQQYGSTLGGQHFQNTAGALTGGQSKSQGQNQSFAPGMSGRGMGGMGGQGGYQDWSGSAPPSMADLYGIPGQTPGLLPPDLSNPGMTAQGNVFQPGTQEYADVPANAPNYGPDVNYGFNDVSAVDY